MNCNRYFVLLLLLSSAIRAPQSAIAQQEVEWRKDYASALEEAQQKRLPLVLDISTDPCVWCDRLDATTFRDPAVVALVNKQFVPLRIKAAQHPRLVERLGVHSFPTIVVAGPTGQILRVQNGFLAAAPFVDLLRDALARAAAAAPPATVAARPEPAPAWMTRDYDQAARAVARSEFAPAVPLLRNVLKEDRKLPVQRQAAKLLKEIEDRAGARLARVKEQDAAGKAAEALRAGQELVRLFDGTNTAAEGQTLVSSLTARLGAREQQRLGLARDLLLQAREELRTEQYLSCLLRCETITTRFADLPESVEAAKLADRIKSSPERMQQLCEGVPELLGTLYLSTAEAKLKQGQPQQAVFLLERVLQAFPNTRQAELAQVRLAQIQGPPPLPVGEDRKPERPTATRATGSNAGL